MMCKYADVHPYPEPSGPLKGTFASLLDPVILIIFNGWIFSSLQIIRMVISPL